MGWRFIIVVAVCSSVTPTTAMLFPPPSEEYVITEKPSLHPHDFDVLLSDSMLFYEAQRSGELPPDNRIPWRGDSFLYDAGFKGEDLTGGWFDAGDHVKFGMPMAWATSVLAWSFLEFTEAYEGERAAELLDTIQWPCDYFVKCHTAENEFYYQVADGNVDHTMWNRPEDLTYHRDVYIINGTTPGSDEICAAAAALASCSVAFTTGVNFRNDTSIVVLNDTSIVDDTSQLADLYRDEARELYDMAKTRLGVAPETSDHYINRRWEDELLWAAVWLHLATGEMSYLDEAETMYEVRENGLRARSWAFDFQDTKEGSRLLLYGLTGNEKYQERASKFLNGILPHHGDISLRYTPKGLYFRAEWGSLRYAANAAFIALVAAQYDIHPKAYREFACNQTNYILGNDIDHSFVVGYGTDPPCRPHHRSSSCPEMSIPCYWGNSMLNEGCNYHELTGAMVGGPNMNDEWTDNRQDFVTNEVAIDYNAGFQGAMAGLQKLKMDDSLELPPACYILG